MPPRRENRPPDERGVKGEDNHGVEGEGGEEGRGWAHALSAMPGGSAIKGPESLSRE